jgi:hypothetical protein
MLRIAMSGGGLAALGGIALSMAGAGARGAVVDLTTSQTGTVNGALVQRADFRPAGSGFINSFVRVSSNQGTEQGYNTSGRPVAFDENTSPIFTRNLTYGNVPVVTSGGVQYKEFMLDINQQSANPLLSLDKIQIFTSAQGSQTTSNVSSLGQLRFDLDAGADNYIKLDYNLNSGSGQGDMFLLVPLSAFAGAADSDFLYLFSRFGDHNANNDGYEEWAVREPGPAVPLPPAALAGLSCLGALGAVRALRRGRMS